MNKNIVGDNVFGWVDPILSPKSVTFWDTNNVRDDIIVKGDTVADVNIGSVKKHVDDASVGNKFVVILDDTPIVFLRIQNPAAICELLYMSKFDSCCSNRQGQPARRVENEYSSNHILSL